MLFFLFILLFRISFTQKCDDLQKLIAANHEIDPTIKGVFTADNYPDKFKDLVSLHIPTVTIDGGIKGKAIVKGHPMVSDHYITDIWVYDEKGNMVTCILLNSSSIAELNFSVPTTAESLTVYEHCNLHGVWAAKPIDVGCSNLTQLIAANSQYDPKVTGVFTRTNFPEKFKDLVDLHIPTVTVDGDSGEAIIKGHPMTSEHYITDIWVYDDKGNMINCVSYDIIRGDFSTADLTFSVPSNVKSIVVYEHCSLHGVWASDPIQIECGDLQKLILENMLRFQTPGAFTVDNHPEAFKDLVKLHIPLVGISVDKKFGHVSLPGHPMTDDHYITGIWVLDESENQVSCTKLTYNDTASDAFDIPDIVKNITVYEHCNVHGVWATSSLNVSLGGNQYFFNEITE